MSAHSRGSSDIVAGWPFADPRFQKFTGPDLKSGGSAASQGRMLCEGAQDFTCVFSANSCVDTRIGVAPRLLSYAANLGKSTLVVVGIWFRMFCYCSDSAARSAIVCHKQVALAMGCFSDAKALDLRPACFLLQRSTAERQTCSWPDVTCKALEALLKFHSLEKGSSADFRQSRRVRQLKLNAKTFSSNRHALAQGQAEKPPEGQLRESLPGAFAVSKLSQRSHPESYFFEACGSCHLQTLSVARTAIPDHSRPYRHDRSGNCTANGEGPEAPRRYCPASKNPPKKWKELLVFRARSPLKVRLARALFQEVPVGRGSHTMGFAQAHHVNGRISAFADAARACGSFGCQSDLSGPGVVTSILIQMQEQK